MPIFHIFLALIVALVWGYNFVAVKIGLEHYPPLLLSALRFATASIPFLIFAGKPDVGWGWILKVGFVLGVVYFAFFFLGMATTMPAGLTSVLLQTQAFFTAGFAFLLLGEKPSMRNLTGTILAFIGVALMANGLLDGNMVGFLLIMAAAATWGYSNILTRQANPGDAFKFMIWVSFVPVFPMLLLSLIFEGPELVIHSLVNTNLEAAATIAYVAFAATLVGFSLWSYLLKRHSASVVAPFSLLVPVFGLSSAALVLNEYPTPLQIVGAVVIIVGLALSSWPTRRKC